MLSLLCILIVWFSPLVNLFCLLLLRNGKINIVEYLKGRHNVVYIDIPVNVVVPITITNVIIVA